MENEKIFATFTTNKRLISIIYKDLLEIKKYPPTYPIVMVARDMNN